MIRIKKGLDIPLSGAPKQAIDTVKEVFRVAVTGADFNGMKPTMKVQEGDTVKTGQLLFECKKVKGVRYTSPASGKVVSINRGAKRVFETLVIEVHGDEYVDFENYKSNSNLDKLSDENVRALLVESGLWTTLRTRPFSKSASLTQKPHSIFITAMDTNPHAPDPKLIIAENDEAFSDGVKILSKLTGGHTYVCQYENASVSVPDSNKVFVHEFSGPHPSGLVGTHIHFVDPVSSSKTVWHVGYQDVIAIGHLFKTGKLNTERIVSISGPAVQNPRLVKTRIGACLNELCKGELEDGNIRLISGNVLNGRKVTDRFCFLGQFHLGVSALYEGDQREFLGWHAPGLDKFSVKRTFLSFFTPNKKFALKTGTHGSLRALVPFYSYEKVMPLDILATQLLRSILTRDTDQAQALGALELDEEDLALCTFASVGKQDFGPILRDNLTIIEKEG
ncbi:MAG: Na(+)-translocating NADH-quinone reductase subunit A [Bacteriovoracaceae bacterium]|jgi:Na+-transporting NADH:ubiquinone oxidoreductase subunit A|nr:Na(+)-translocating NADH-quinone reductase subunit A [Bacteriovoracaceae bacterium]